MTVIIFLSTYLYNGYLSVCTSMHAYLYNVQRVLLYKYVVQRVPFSSMYTYLYKRYLCYCLGGLENKTHPGTTCLCFSVMMKYMSYKETWTVTNPPLTCCWSCFSKEMTPSPSEIVIWSHRPSGQFGSSLCSKYQTKSHLHTNLSIL